MEGSGSRMSVSEYFQRPAGHRRKRSTQISLSPYFVCKARALPRILSHEIGNLPICVIHCWLGSRLKDSQNNEPDAVRMCGSGKM